MKKHNPALNLPTDPASNVPLDPADLREHPAVVEVYKGSAMRRAAAAHGISPSTLARWIETVRDAFGDEGLPASYVSRSAKLKRIGTDATYTYPVYARVPGGAFNGSDQYDDEPIGTYSTTLRVRKKADNPDPFAMTVTGHSMTNPASDVQFPDGSQVLCDPGVFPDLGDFVVAGDLTDGSMTLKKLVNRVPLPERELWLEPLNSAYPAIKYDDSNHKIIGVVVDAMMPLYRKAAKTGRR